MMLAMPTPPKTSRKPSASPNMKLRKIGQKTGYKTINSSPAFHKVVKPKVGKDKKPKQLKVPSSMPSRTRQLKKKKDLKKLANSPYITSRTLAGSTTAPASPLITGKRQLLDPLGIDSARKRALDMSHIDQTGFVNLRYLNKKAEKKINQQLSEITITASHACQMKGTAPFEVPVRTPSPPPARESPMASPLQSGRVIKSAFQKFTDTPLSTPLGSPPSTPLATPLGSPKNTDSVSKRKATYMDVEQNTPEEQSLHSALEGWENAANKSRKKNYNESPAQSPAQSPCQRNASLTENSFVLKHKFTLDQEKIQHPSNEDCEMERGNGIKMQLFLTQGPEEEEDSVNAELCGTLSNPPSPRTNFDLPSLGHQLQMPAPAPRTDQIQGEMTNGKMRMQQTQHGRSSYRARRVSLSALQGVQVLGTGAFGEVKLVLGPHVHREETTETGYTLSPRNSRSSAKSPQGGHRTYALKTISKHHLHKLGSEALVMAEKTALMELSSHPLITTLHQTMQDDNYLYFLFDPLLGGDYFALLNRFGPLLEKPAQFYGACIISAVRFMHSKGYIYRDLKPENLMVDKDGYVVVTDFGYAKKMSFPHTYSECETPDFMLKQSSTPRTYTTCGTPDYMAPEMLSGEGHSYAVDWWTVGVLMYETLVGCPPFAGDTYLEKATCIQTKEPEYPEFLSEHAASLLKQLLDKDPDRRNPVDHPVWDHPFFEGVNWWNIETRETRAPWKPTLKGKLDTDNFVLDELDLAGVPGDRPKKNDPPLPPGFQSQLNVSDGWFDQF